MVIVLLTMYPLMLLVMTFYGAKFSGKGKLASDFLSLEQTKLIQGFACIAVVLHHITQQVTGYGVYVKGPITILNYCGIAFTAIFFFSSGYGLITSVYTKEHYLDSFLKKRLPTVLIPFWVINVLGVMLKAFGYGVRYTKLEVISDISGYTLVNSNGWFIIEILFIYLFFYLLFSLFSKKDVALFFLSVVVVLIIVYSFFQGHDADGDKSHWFRGEWWFNSTIVFVFGMYFARFKDGIAAFCNKHYKVVMAITTVLSVIFLYGAVFVVVRYGYYTVGFGFRDKLITLIVQSIYCLISTMFIILLNMRITLGNKVLKYISGMSVELFLIHGYFVGTIFGGVRMPDVRRFAVVLASSIACTAVISPIVRWLVKKIVALLNPKKFVNDTLEAAIAQEKRKKRGKALRTATAVIVIIGSVAFISAEFGYRLFAGRRYAEECEAINNAKVGDEVLWGCYETDPAVGKERLSWIVVNKVGDEVCLVTKEGIDGYWYNQKHEPVTWEDSDLRAKLNDREYVSGILSKYELASVVVKNDDIFTLLTVNEAQNFFESDRDRQLQVTEEARIEGVNVNELSKVNEWDMKGYRSSWWWLRGTGQADVYAPVVTVDGTIDEHFKEVNRAGGAIRPVVWVNCNRVY